MSDIDDACPHCGSKGEIAFVKYHADLNDAQEETEWGDNVADRLYSIVCQDCGLGRATIDPRQQDDLPDFEDLPHGEGTSSFKVDEELE